MSARPPGIERSLRLVSLVERGDGLVARLGRESLRLGFHPVVDLERARVVGYEVVLGSASEPEAVPESPAGWSQRGHAAQAGAVEGPLVRAALAACRRLPPDAFLLVKVSARALLGVELPLAFAGEPGLARVVVAVSDDTQPGERPAVARALARLRSAGASFAVDDTSGGGESLHQIVRLRPQLVRVGVALTSELDRDPARAAVVEALGAVASRLDARLVAVDVPGLAELHALMRFGVRFAQGPVFGEAGAAMAPLSDAALAAVATGHIPLRAERTVAEAVEPLEPLPAGLSTGEVADRFLADPRHDALVAVDAGRRPVALLDRAALLRGEDFASEPMTVPFDEPLAEVARRAVSRRRDDRLRSLVCCDGYGRYVGIIRIERLLDALASGPTRRRGRERRRGPGE